jgi:hypothetical protein
MTLALMKGMGINICDMVLKIILGKTIALSIGLKP